MPSSRPEPLPYICNAMINLKPKSLLDIGCGFGKYGFLAREYLEGWRVHQEGYWKWTATIDAIEIYEKYIGTLQKIIYNEIYIGNALEILPQLKPYDMIIMSDMLEHLKEEDGFKMLDMIKEKSTAAMIVTPINVLPQGSVYGNIHESHISSFSEETLKKYGKVLRFGNAFCLDIR